MNAGSDFTRNAGDANNSWHYCDTMPPEEIVWRLQQLREDVGSIHNVLDAIRTVQACARDIDQDGKSDTGRAWEWVLDRLSKIGDEVLFLKRACTRFCCVANSCESKQ